MERALIVMSAVASMTNIILSLFFREFGSVMGWFTAFMMSLANYINNINRDRNDKYGDKSNSK